ncbi:Uncharacterized protein OBRU01_04864 [Operophtera brumata]|uniref:Uncharacterized protein n=1 Tax=Operophtera brumata TaxID=104452 RepID=A0A0L7LNC7_OPEBR|nr:Uncharacterized protein OBRU01_04864 [Operophtera brumata]
MEDHRTASTIIPRDGYLATRYLKEAYLFNTDRLIQNIKNASIQEVRVRLVTGIALVEAGVLVREIVILTI